MKMTFDVSEHQAEFAECKPGDEISMTIEGTVTAHSPGRLTVDVTSMTKEKYGTESEEGLEGLGEEELGEEYAPPIPPPTTTRTPRSVRDRLVIMMRR
jgi:hypothetical protein